MLSPDLNNAIAYLKSQATFGQRRLGQSRSAGHWRPGRWRRWRCCWERESFQHCQSPSHTPSAWHFSLSLPLGTLLTLAMLAVDRRSVWFVTFTVNWKLAQCVEGAPASSGWWVQEGSSPMLLPLTWH